MQVKRLFGRCQIVGTRFPIALVHSGGLVLEVSSFGTKAKRGTIPADAAAFLQAPAPKGTVSASCSRNEQCAIYHCVSGREGGSICSDDALVSIVLSEQEFFVRCQNARLLFLQMCLYMSLRCTISLNVCYK